MRGGEQKHSGGRRPGVVCGTSGAWNGGGGKQSSARCGQRGVGGVGRASTKKGCGAVGV